MRRIVDSEWIESAGSVVGIALLFVCPVLFLVGAWLVDRRVRRHGSAAKRWFALSLFATVVLLLFAVLIRVPPSWQFASSSSTIVSISYIVGLGWLATPLIAVPCIVIGVCGGVIARLLATRRSPSTYEV